MAEGTTYEIEVQAKGIGADATKDQVLGLADAIEAAERVLTPFDSALEATSAQLDAATAAADVATQGLAEAEAEYKRLERAATSAAKKVERAQAKGKDTGALRAAADAAAAAVTKQAAAVDAAATKANKAAAAQKELAAAYRTVERRAARAAEETRGTERSFGDLFGAAGALGGPLGGLAGQISGVGDGLRAGGLKGGLITLGFAAGNVFIMMTKAAIGLTLAMAGAVTGLLAFAVASDKATTEKLSKAWEKAKKNAKGLFEGVKTEKLVRPVERLLKLLDKNTSAGKGLAHIFETILNPLIDGLEDAGPLAEEFTKGLIIGALRAIIFVKKLRNAVVGAIPKETREKIKGVVSELLSLNSAADAGEKSFKTMGSAVVVVGIGMLVLVGIVGALTAALLAVPASIGLAVVKITEALEKMRAGGEGAGRDLVEGISEGVTAAVGGLAGVVGNLGRATGKAIRKILLEEGGKSGQELINGIVGAITAGVGGAALAATNLGKAVGKALKASIESKSPSKLAYRIMKTVPEGAVLALEGGVPSVRRASEEIGTAAGTGLKTGQERSAEKPRPKEGGGHKGDINLSITVHAPTGDGDEIAAKVKEAAMELFDGVALQLGAGETVAA